MAAYIRSKNEVNALVVAPCVLMTTEMLEPFFAQILIISSKSLHCSQMSYKRMKHILKIFKLFYKWEVMLCESLKMNLSGV